MLKRILSFALTLLISSLASSQCVIINEILINGPGPNDGSNSPFTEEWVELYNTCGEAVDIGCSVLADGDFTVTIPENTILQPYDYFLIGSPSSGLALDLDWSACNCAQGTGIGIFTNSNEQLLLSDGTGIILDAIQWGNGQFPLNATSIALGSCMPIEFSSEPNSSDFFIIPDGGGNGCSMARTCDGASEWVERCDLELTPDASNGAGNATVNFMASETGFCPGGCISFEDQSVIDAISWNWSFPGADVTSSSDQNPSNICYSAPGTYDVTLSIQSTCGSVSYTMVDYIQVSSGEIPVIQYAGDLNFCEGESLLLSTTASGPYQWFFNDEIITNANSSSYEVTQAGSYFVAAGVENCSANSLPVNTVVLQNPVVTIAQGSFIEVCANQTTSLQATPGFANYEWYINDQLLFGNNGSEILAIAEGEYSVIVTNTDGCQGEFTTEINWIYIPDPMIISSSGSYVFCEGSSVVLTVNGMFDTYQWYFNDTPIGNTSQLVASVEGTYQVICSLDVCESEPFSVYVDEIEGPTISINPAGPIVVCDENIVLSAVGNAQFIQWTLNGNPIFPGNGITQLATESGNYQAIGSNQSNCTTFSNIVEVTILDGINITISQQPQVACEGDEVTLTATAGLDEYEWNTGSNANSIEVTSSGVYTLTASDDDCVSTLNYNLSLSPLPLVDAGHDTIADCINGVVLFGTGEGNLEWIQDGTVNSPESSITLVTPDHTTIYTLVAELDGCTAQDQVIVVSDCEDMRIPNVFTPNGDGKNDTFEVRAAGLSSYSIKIFNRWGNLVFESTQLNQQWSGKVNGNDAPEGTYYYVIEAMTFDGKPYASGGLKGSLTLIR